MRNKGSATNMVHYKLEMPPTVPASPPSPPSPASVALGTAQAVSKQHPQPCPCTHAILSTKPHCLQPSRTLRSQMLPLRSKAPPRPPPRRPSRPCVVKRGGGEVEWSAPGAVPLLSSGPVSHPQLQPGRAGSHQPACPAAARRHSPSQPPSRQRSLTSNARPALPSVSIGFRHCCTTAATSVSAARGGMVGREERQAGAAWWAGEANVHLLPCAPRSCSIQSQPLPSHLPPPPTTHKPVWRSRLQLARSSAASSSSSVDCCDAVASACCCCCWPGSWLALRASSAPWGATGGIGALLREATTHHDGITDPLLPASPILPKITHTPGAVHPPQPRHHCPLCTALTAAPPHFLCHQLSGGHVYVSRGIHLALHHLHLANHCMGRTGERGNGWQGAGRCQHG